MALLNKKNHLFLYYYVLSKIHEYKTITNVPQLDSMVELFKLAFAIN